MKKEFKVGNKVWSKRFGHGIVILKEEDCIMYPIHVSFLKKGLNQYYTEEGRLFYHNEIELFHKRDVFPTLWQRIINKLKKKS